METLIYKIFLENWQRKIVAVALAVILWLCVNYSITATKTILGVPIRIINLPADKTIQGLLPNGILNKRIALTLSGRKNVIRELEPGDLEVLIDSSSIDRDEWVLLITKKNLISLSPDIDLAHSISNVEHPEFIIKMSRLITAKIPITILPPIGNSPPGYELLDIWPQKLMQTLSGPEEAIQSLKIRGLEVVFDLNEITKAELDAIHSAHLNAQNDEISFHIPNHWKEVAIPFHNNSLEEINDPEAQHLRIDFLRNEFISIDKEIPIRIFYPLKSLEEINPQTCTLAISDRVKERHGATIFNQKIFTKNVSSLFVEIIKPNMEIVISAAPKNERETLLWSLEVVAAEDLENTYVAYFMGDLLKSLYNPDIALSPQHQETLLRKRFRDYLQKLTLYSSPDQKLQIDSYWEDKFIKVKS